MPSKIAVTIVTGFLGSGKTTLLSNSLEMPEFHNAAVIVNEFGEVPLDHYMVYSAPEMTRIIGGGCVCCSVREDLVTEMKNILDRRYANDTTTSIDHLIIETTGLADPSPIAFTILTDPVLQHHFYLSGIVVTVDAVNGKFHLDEHPESLKQLSMADVVVITKTDLVPKSVVLKMLDLVSSLNAVVDVRLFNHNDSPPAVFTDKWTHYTEGDLKNMTKTERISHPDVESVSVSFNKPIDWTGFAIWLSMLLHAHGEEILRVKGIVDVGYEGPVVINGVQHIIHPPQHMRKWPTHEHKSRVVFISRNLDTSLIESSLRQFNELVWTNTDLEKHPFK